MKKTIKWSLYGLLFGILVTIINLLFPWGYEEKAWQFFLNTFTYMSTIPFGYLLEPLEGLIPGSFFFKLHLAVIINYTLIGALFGIGSKYKHLNRKLFILFLIGAIAYLIIVFLGIGNAAR